MSEGSLMLRVPADKRIAATWGLITTAVLAGLIVAGSRNLNHFDAALAGVMLAFRRRMVDRAARHCSCSLRT
jgi:hypothetical protein